MMALWGQAPAHEKQPKQRRSSTTGTLSGAFRRMLPDRHAATGAQSRQCRHKAASTLGTMSSQRPLPSAFTHQFLQASQYTLCVPRDLDLGPYRLYHAVRIDEIGDTFR
jgi:hypothetical protein